ncbi:MAG TPA: aspartyl/asparaginyl beta-hydroxylase domain-containing protein [Cytophagales bacterium]|nr:aspartyl/asparaginyl beta-hydroxylase domain-containing protein [Cytophagales bacterium]HAA21802.1 aspartyl/asparaginyl beta-hydroxylase domain-containing protein [Cytophagales bacterium]HAP59281.1 aspartyl/asparaginyl beta-hydroxylase domain-containing protein [Cytophagales bacterium]
MIAATRHLKLPFQFDEAKLVQDLSALKEDLWIPHYNTQGYAGEWKVIPLYAPQGDGTNIVIFTPDQESRATETQWLKACPYFKEVIDSFQFPIVTARILRLAVGSEIKPHRDHELGYEDGCFRLHIPIVTNPEVHFVLDGDELTMLPGECWYTNVNYEHSVVNAGTQDRMHLVIDGERNAWSDELFFSLAPQESFEPTEGLQEESPETLQRIIEELERSDLPIAKELIAENKEKLARLTSTSRS